MNKPIPALDERGEFVEAKLRDGGTATVYAFANCQVHGNLRGTAAYWEDDGIFILGMESDSDIINLPEIRATVERARKARDAIRTAAGITFARNQNFYGGGTGQVEKAPAPARPSFAEALLVELEGAADGVDSRECTVTLADMLAWFGSARRASEGSV